jgi:threonine dehydrogenase-like Zn-dependent dehydrogenase
MKALRFDDRLRLSSDEPIPRRAGEALIEVIAAGICGTDLEITKGYAGYRGILGHEFVGRVVDSPEGLLLGQRVVGEINAGCGQCDLCRSGDARHCPDRTVLGIKDREGAFAEFLSLPVSNLLVMPPSVSDEEAVLVEPLAAACQILEQVKIADSTGVVIIGDGRLAQLIARVVGRTGCALTMIGKHKAKLELAEESGARCLYLENAVDYSGQPDASKLLQSLGGRPDVVIEASGSASGLRMALSIVRPLGTVVLKSTHQGTTSVEMFQAVVSEVTIIGSRCGRFAPAIDLLNSGAVKVKGLISDRLPLDEGVAAFGRAAQPDALKVILQVRT